MTTPLQLGLARHLDAARRERLAAVRVGVAGAGGLGSNVAVLLVRSGLRRFTLVDFDTVEASNLNRQSYWPEDLGERKVDALARRLLALEPDLDLAIFAQRIDAANARAIFGLDDDDAVDADGGDNDNSGAGFPRCGVIVEALDGAADKAMLFDSLAGRADFWVGASGIAGWGGPPMGARRLGKNAVVVGDFAAAVGPGRPPMAPRVTMAAAWQADCVLSHLLGEAEA